MPRGTLRESEAKDEKKKKNREIEKNVTALA